MKNIYEIGDKVKITATKDCGICFSNDVGGTAVYPIHKPIVVTISKTWTDYERGRRYIGKTNRGKQYYFGEFGVKIELA